MLLMRPGLLHIENLSVGSCAVSVPNRKHEQQKQPQQQNQMLFTHFKKARKSRRKPRRETEGVELKLNSFLKEM